MAAWETIALVGIVTMLLRASGPLIFGNRPLPGRLVAVIDLVGPVLLVSLIATAIFVSPGRLVLDARAAGLVAALGAVALRAPVYVVVLVAAAATALVRAAA